MINNLGEIIDLKATSGNVHDVAVMESLTLELKGILLGDKGYLSKTKVEALAARGLKLLTSSRKNMKHTQPKTSHEKELLSRRGLIETVNDQLKNLHQVEHSLHHELLRTVKRLGRTLWKKWSGYHRRSLVETKMYCIKLLGDKLSARNFDSQVNEIHTRVAVLNKFTELGRPHTRVVP